MGADELFDLSWCARTSSLFCWNGETGKAPIERIFADDSQRLVLIYAVQCSDQCAASGPQLGSARRARRVPRIPFHPDSPGLSRMSGAMTKTSSTW